MNYPDGQPVCVGDLIWWNEGSCVGHVQVVAETQEEFEAWGLDEPHIFVGNTHPFDPAIGRGVAYNERCFEEEGIGLMNQKEKECFEAAVKAAESMAVTDLKSHQFSVTRKCANGRVVAWIFDIKEGDRLIEKVRVPL